MLKPTLIAVQDQKLGTFLEKVGPQLYRNEALNSLMLGLCEMSRGQKEQPLFFRLEEAGKTVAAALRSLPPYLNIILSPATSEQLSVLANHMKNIEVGGVVGPSREAEVFSELLSRLQNKSKTLRMSQKIYQIKEVIPPHAVAGEFKMATENELHLLTQWAVDFAKESLPPNERYPFEHFKPLVLKKIQSDWISVWIENGKPVSTAQLSRATLNGITVNGVYTPKEHRKKGYASAVTAALSRKMLDSGKKFCVLYTDASNPSSNKIYQDIGYQELATSSYFGLNSTHQNHSLKICIPMGIQISEPLLF